MAEISLQLERGCYQNKVREGDVPPQPFFLSFLLSKAKAVLLKWVDAGYHGHGKQILQLPAQEMKALWKAA